MDCLIDSVHDNTIKSYQVDLEEGKIVLTTSRSDAEDVVVEFSGVMAHYFESPIRNSMILDIDEQSIDTFVLRNKFVLEKFLNYGWPMICKDLEELEKFLIENSYRYYVIYASYGLNGWVLSKEVESSVVGLKGTKESIS